MRAAAKTLTRLCGWMMSTKLFADRLNMRSVAKCRPLADSNIGYVCNKNSVRKTRLALIWVLQEVLTN